MAYTPHFNPPPERKGRWVWPVVILGIVIVLISGCVCMGLIGAASQDTADTGTISEVPASKTVGALPSESGDGKIRDEGWRIDSLKFSVEYDMPKAVAEITNESSSSDVSIFTITALEGKKVVATFNGSASEIQKGETTTVEFIGDSAGGFDAKKKYTLRFESGL